MYDAIILLAGKGERAKLDYNKAFYILGDKPIYQYSLDLFLSDPRCNNVILVINQLDKDKFGILPDNVITTYGGKTRMESVYCGLSHVTSDYVLIHDAARPNINMDLINNLLIDVYTYNATALAVKVVDAIKEVNLNHIKKTLKRDELIQMQTPQAVKSSIYKEALKKAIDDGVSVYDDMEVVELYTDITPVYTNGSYSNIKVTNKIDFKIMEVIMREKLWWELDIHTIPID